MVRSESYNRGRSWRDQYLKSKRKKEAKKDPKLVFKTEDDLFKRIGSADDYSTEAFYDWNIILSNYALNSNDEVPKMRSLKDLCAMKITKHHQLINHELLKTGNWSIWGPVWRYLVRWRRDNYKLFQTFADVFCKESSFACHDNLESYPMTRYRTILSSTSQDAKRHRVERLFSNVKLHHFITFVNGAKFENLAILEIVKDLQDHELIELTNLSNLTALKIVQRTELKDTIINSWCSAMKSQKWTKLQVLCLPRVSESSVGKLQRLASSSRLLYIEPSFESSRFDIRNQWRSLNLNEWDLISEKAIIEQPLGLKLQILLSLNNLKERSIVPSGSTILLDFNIVDIPFLRGSEFISQGEHDDLWNLGQVRSCSQGLLLKKELKPEVKVISRVGHTGVKRMKVNPKSKMASVNSFFDL